MPTGVVKFYNEGRGFGFIFPDGGGPDLFVHIKNCRGMDYLREGNRVQFEERINNRSGKPEAFNVVPAEGDR
jgi:cold shock protein